MLDIDSIRSLHKTNKRLFGLICQFNANPAGYTHPSHIEGELPVSALNKIKQNPRGCKKLSQVILKEHGLKDSLFTDFKDPRRRIALLDRPLMDKLITFAGAAYYSENITQVIQKDVVLKLKKRIGEDAYLFAVKRAPFILRSKPMLPNLSANPASLEESVPEAGHRLLEICFNKEPEPLLERIKLHFPKGTPWDFNQDIPDGQREQIWTFLYQILIKEISPAWKPCFT